MYYSAIGILALLILIITNYDEFGVIDFGRWCWGDPYMDFQCIRRSCSAPFSRGQINGYFGGNIPGDFFALMTGKLLNKTKEGKPFFKVTFRDAKGEAQSAIWSDSPFFLSCRDTWQIGKYYKIRGVFKVTDYGPQVLIQRIREARESDIADGFSKSLCRPS